MKILELRFKNLNSLYGQWSIDFTRPEYTTNGLFALTGPTGAGKSTILDAICLALYGATPRLGKITQSGNEIMSRQTGECFAEVVFESKEGRFRCHWAQHRSRKQPNGALQSPTHEISDVLNEGKVVENQIRRVQAAVEEKTGMDLDRFTRSVLLAQGSFDTFLKASVEQKSSVLEQITGSEIYSTISKQVHERNRSEKENLQSLVSETSGIVILEPELEKEIQEDLKSNEKKEPELAGRSNAISQAIAWILSVDALKKDILSLKEEAAKQQLEIEAFKPERDKLEGALKATSLDGNYATLAALRKQQSDDQGELKTVEVALPELEKRANKQAETLKSAEQLTLKAKADLKTAAPLIQKIRSLDQKLAEKGRAVSGFSESCTKLITKIDTQKQSREKEQRKRIEAEKTLAGVEDYLTKHQKDEWLIGGLAGIEEQFGHLLARQKEISQKEVDFKSANAALLQVVKQLEESTKECATRKLKLEQVAKSLQKEKGILSELLAGRLLREYRTEKESLQKEKEYLARIAALEDHRAKLEDDQPCPLCGSTEHPFAEGNVPQSDEKDQKIEALTKLIAKAEDQEAIIKKLEEAEVAALKNLNDGEKLEVNAINDKKAAEKALAELKHGTEKLRALFAELKQAVSLKLQPLGIFEIQDSQVSLLLESLESRLKAWQEQSGKKIVIEKQISDIDSEMKGLHAVIESQTASLTEHKERLELLKKEQAAGVVERKKGYGDKNPDDEEVRFNQTIGDAEEAEKKAGVLHSELQLKLTTERTRFNSLKNRIEQRQPDLEKEESGFLSALQAAGFSDEDQFLKARLSSEERAVLASRAKELENAQTDLKARQKDRETRLASESAKSITDKPLEQLQEQFKDHETALKALRDTIAGIKHRLRENALAKERIKEKQTAIDAQKKECMRWERLHCLIGSADGKKYRNFAQGLTFELMVSHANQQLAGMTDRYLLIRDQDEPLELNVLDNYQAGEIRSTRNLSGGESFIVSLALALGLSKMASRKVRVDSLFLDEGFGTLDSEALETALEMLSGLHEDGKLIGIISHVAALKERISTQILITPETGGRSSLSGPGCQKLNVA